MNAERLDADWWKNAVVYQIYPRSFADGNADGIGDLPGITSRIPYLSRLGVDAIWLSPFYPSPLKDGGYDVADYRDVDPRLGTLAEFDVLTAQAHAAGIRVMVDIVPNHTSDQHPWFQEALAAPVGSRARERYIFRDGLGEHGDEPPSDWRAHFGGSAWQRESARGQWYLHLFTPEQPDLNWDDSEVRQYFLDTLRFWADRGVDGFRIDVAHALVKDMSEPLRSQPSLDRRLPDDGSDPLYDREALHEIYRSWRHVFDEYDPPRMAVAETWHPINERTFLYGRPDELGQVFDFSLHKSSWNADQLRSVIQRSLKQHARHHGAPTWVLSNHDVSRHASRLALPEGVDADAWIATDGTEPVIDLAVGLRRARAATAMMLALPGSPYLYQGEELGLPEVADLPPQALHDPTWLRSGRTVKGRDGARIPLPWTCTGSSFGFGDDGSWLPQPASFGALSVQAQDDVAESTLSMYREAIALRRELDLGGRPFAWQDSPPGVLCFDRGETFRCVVNVGGAPVPLPPKGLLLVSSPLRDASALPPDHTAWIRVAPADR